MRADLCLKSTVMLPKLKYIHWQTNILTNVVNAIFPVDNKDRVRGLIFGFHTRIPAANNGEASNIYPNYVNATGAQFKTPLGYFP